jgi:hypothetical protein
MSAAIFLSMCNRAKVQTACLAVSIVNRLKSDQITNTKGNFLKTIYLNQTNNFRRTWWFHEQFDSSGYSTDSRWPVCQKTRNLNFHLFDNSIK